MTISGIRDHQFTVGQIVRHGYIMAGMLNIQQSPNVDQESFAEQQLDALVSELVIEGIFPRDVKPYDVPLVNGTNTYSLPTWVFDVFDNGMWRAAVAYPSDSEMIVMQMSRVTYSSLQDKHAQGQPTRYFCDRTTEPPSVVFWPEPDATQTGAYIRLQCHQLKSKNVGINTADYERFWTDYLIHALASRLADSAGFTGQASRMGQLANEKKQLCKAYSNDRPNEQMYMAHYSPWRGR